MATARQVRAHALNIRMMQVAIRILRAGIVRVLDAGRGPLYAAAVQYLMPASQAEAERLLKADAGDIFDADDLSRAGIDPLSSANQLTFEQITELGLTLNADSFGEFFRDMFGQDLDVLMQSSATASGNAWIGTLNPQSGLNFQERITVEWMRENGLDLAGDVADSLKPQLREALAQTIIDRDVSVANMKRALTAELQDWETWRLDRLARTEGNFAMSAGAEEAYIASDVVDRKEWFNPDPQAPPCILNNGEVRKLGDTFSSGHKRPPAHPNCESSILPVLA